MYYNTPFADFSDFSELYEPDERRGMLGVHRRAIVMRHQCNVTQCHRCAGRKGDTLSLRALVRLSRFEVASALDRALEARHSANPSYSIFLVCYVMLLSGFHTRSDENQHRSGTGMPQCQCRECNSAFLTTFLCVPLSTLHVSIQKLGSTMK